MVRLLGVTAGLPPEHEAPVSIDHLRLDWYREGNWITNLLKDLRARGDTRQLQALADRLSLDAPYWLPGTTSKIYACLEELGLHAYSARIAEHAVDSGYYDLCRSFQAPRA